MVADGLNLSLWCTGIRPSIGTVYKGTNFAKCSLYIIVMALNDVQNKHREIAGTQNTWKANSREANNYGILSPVAPYTIINFTDCGTNKLPIFIKSEISMIIIILTIVNCHCMCIMVIHWLFRHCFTRWYWLRNIPRHFLRPESVI